MCRHRRREPERGGGCAVIREAQRETGKRQLPSASRGKVPGAVHPRRALGVASGDDNGGTLHGRARRAVCNDGEFCDHMTAPADIGSGTRTQDGRTHRGEDRLKAKYAANPGHGKYCKMRRNGG